MEKLNLAKPAKLPPKRTSPSGGNIYDQVMADVKKSITIPAPKPVQSTLSTPAPSTSATPSQTVPAPVPKVSAPVAPVTSATQSTAAQPSVNNNMMRQPNIPANPAAQAAKARQPKSQPAPTYYFNFGSTNPFAVPAQSAAQPAQVTPIQ